MTRSFYTRTGISVSEDIPLAREVLNVASSKACILVLGPQLAIPSNLKTRKGNSDIYLRRLLKSIVECTIQQNGIIEPTIAESLRKLPTKTSLAHTGKIFEEYLIGEDQLQLCMTEVLRNTSRVTRFYQNLVRLPIRGYISTTYDISLQSAYERVHQCTLPKFYSSSIRAAIHAYQHEKQFMLKLYGDIDDAASIIFSQRLNKGLASIGEQNNLRELFSLSEVMFLGFEETDPDLHYLRSLLPDNQHYNLLSLSQLQTFTRKHKLNWWEDIDATSHNPHSPYTSITFLPEAETHSTFLASTSSSTHKIRTREVPSPTHTTQSPPIEIYTAYAQSDERFYNKIKDQLDILHIQGKRISCHASEITYSTTWRKSNHLQTAHLILLLVSTTFLKSSFCYSKQVCQAVERHRTDKLCCVMPVILHPLSDGLLQGTPFGELDFLPTNRKAISEWNNSHKAYKNIIDCILEKLGDIAYYL